MNKIEDRQDLGRALEALVSMEHEIFMTKRGVVEFLVESKMLEFFSVDWKRLKRHLGLADMQTKER